MSHSRPQALKCGLEEHPQHRTVGLSGTTAPARRCSPGQQVPDTTDGLGDGRGQGDSYRGRRCSDGEKFLSCSC